MPAAPLGWPTASFRFVVAHGCGPDEAGDAEAGGLAGVAVTVTVLVGVTVGAEDPHAAPSRARDVTQQTASSRCPVIADALMLDHPSPRSRRSLM